MDGNQRKIRNLLLYIGIPVVVLFIIILLFNNRAPQTAAYKYSDILDYFQSQEVTGYRLNLGTGDMAIQLEKRRDHRLSAAQRGPVLHGCAGFHPAV